MQTQVAFTVAFLKQRKQLFVIEALSVGVRVTLWGTTPMRKEEESFRFKNFDTGKLLTVKDRSGYVALFDEQFTSFLCFSIQNYTKFYMKVSFYNKM